MYGVVYGAVLAPFFASLRDGRVINVSSGWGPSMRLLASGTMPSTVSIPYHILIDGAE